MNVSKYLERIGYQGDGKPTEETLFALQYAHLTHVPYENLDILSGIPLSLKVEDLYEKIVLRGRGGYCFELNALYAWLLRELGYEVCDYFARFLYGEAKLPKRRHHVLGVTLPGTDLRFLSDVGVGVGSPNYPVEMAYQKEQAQGNEAYRFDYDTFLGWVLKVKKENRDWVSLFSFTEEPQLPQDFTAISYFCEHAPESPFNKEPMVAMRTPEGRVTLDGSIFKRFMGSDVTAWEAKDEGEYNNTLKTLFGIQV